MTEQKSKTNYINMPIFKHYNRLHTLFTITTRRAIYPVNSSGYCGQHIIHTFQFLNSYHQFTIHNRAPLSRIYVILMPHINEMSDESVYL